MASLDVDTGARRWVSQDGELLHAIDLADTQS
ncbi:hypothetical protein ABH930_001382 [Kitasatospora sp. GAS204A]|nr:hypothetical protein [Kitasatospora sp. GAS204B]